MAKDDRSENIGNGNEDRSEVGGTDRIVAPVTNASASGTDNGKPTGTLRERIESGNIGRGHTGGKRAKAQSGPKKQPKKPPASVSVQENEIRPVNHDFIDVDDELEEKPKTKATTKVSKASAKATESALLAGTLLTVVEQLASAGFRKDADFSKEERDLIEPPLTRTLDKLDVASIQKATALLDPLFILVGFGLWINRVAPRPEKKQKDTAQPATTSNGNGKQPASESVKPIISGSNYFQSLQNAARNRRG